MFSLLYKDFFKLVRPLWRWQNDMTALNFDICAASSHPVLSSGEFDDEYAR